MQKQTRTAQGGGVNAPGAYPGAGIAHDGNEAVEEDHRHGEDKEQQQNDANDGVMTLVEQVQVCAPQHDGKQGHKGVEDVAELLHSTQQVSACSTDQRPCAADVLCRWA